jgi:hypothetical protein
MTYHLFWPDQQRGCRIPPALAACRSACHDTRSVTIRHRHLTNHTQRASLSKVHCLSPRTSETKVKPRSSHVLRLERLTLGSRPCCPSWSVIPACAANSAECPRAHVRRDNLLTEFVSLVSVGCMIGQACWSYAEHQRSAPRRPCKKLPPRPTRKPLELIIACGESLSQATLEGCRTRHPAGRART